MSHVSITNVSKSFGDTNVLENINLNVNSGDFVTLLGPSGCGKTTLLRIIAGLERPDKGSITSNDDIFVDTSKGRFVAPQKRKLGFVFQDYGLWPHLTVKENVAFPLEMEKMPRPQISQRVAEVLADVRLSKQADRLPEQLSGGQKQRVSIARAIAGKPSVILFDEPLSNLDANLREELGQDIRLLSKQRGLTCINVTHDRREAQILSDYIALMKDGAVHQFGRPEDIFRTPKDAWAAAFLDAGNILPAAIITNNDHASDRQVLVPRGAFCLSDRPGGPDALEAHVLNCIFIDDRFEITAEFHDQIIKLFADRAVAIGETVGLSIDENNVLQL